MAKLTKEARGKIPSSNFALPGRRFPIEDAKHARAAIMLSNKGTTPEEAAEVRRKAKAKLGGGLAGAMSKMRG